MPRTPNRAVWVLVAASAGLAFVLALAAYRLPHAEILLAVLSFFTSALAVAIALIVRRPLAARPRAWIPAQLPLQLEQFRGRELELQELMKKYERLRGVRGRFPGMRRVWRRPSQGQRTGPVILLIEGMPGVGKTALAQALAHRIAEAGDCPDGQLYTNLGFAGGRRPPADVLHDFLTALGVPSDEMPLNTADRAKLFRSLTVGRRLLVLLDAAWGNDQIPHLLPASDRCAVIVTRRSSIGSLGWAAVHHLLKPMDTASSLEVLQAFSRHDPVEAGADAAQIVDYAGGLPLALRSAGEQIANGRSAGELADELAKPDARLCALAYQARDIGERIKSEYVKLMPEEQCALQVLSTVESPTFGSWVLAPLMEIHESKAEKLVARLATYNLVEEVSGRHGTGLKRYRLHSLVSLIARNELQATMTPTDKQQVQERLYATYLEAVSKVLGLVAPMGNARPWTRFEKMWLPKVRQRENQWVRAEYCTLLGVIRFAYRVKAWDLSWNIAARLGACVTTQLPPDQSIDAFNDALDAADKAGSSLGRIEVLLARGSFQIAADRFEAAFADLREALQETEDATQADLSPAERRRLWASAHRRKAEGWIQLGAYASANLELEVARAAVTGLPDSGPVSAEILHIGLLASANDTFRLPDKWLDQEASEKARKAHDRPLDDRIKFRADLDLADQAQRRREWATALDLLTTAYLENYGDDRRIANIQYRIARLLLSEGRVRFGGDSEKLGRMAVGYASDAVRIHREMKNEVGVIRAEALLVSGLRATGYKSAATVLSNGLRSRLERLEASDPARRALLARVQRSEGELLIDEPEGYERACEALTNAGTQFAGEADWHSAAQVWLTLADAQFSREQFDRAAATISRASEICTAHCQDKDLKEEVDRMQQKIWHTMTMTSPYFPM
jgi:DNA polymerase III delta prime subunit